MSWFTEMAGKAESFLNKMDQVTAAAVSKTISADGTNLDESRPTSQPSLVTHQPKYTPNASVSKSVTHSRTSSLSSSFSTVSSRDVHGISGDPNHGHSLYGINHNSPHYSGTNYGNPNMTLSSDDKIFEYLNSTTDSSTPTASSLSMSSRGHLVRKLSDDDTSNASIEVVSNASDSGEKITPISLPNEAISLPNEAISLPNEAISDRRLSSSSIQRSSPFMASSTMSESDGDEPKRIFEEGTRVVTSLREEMQSLTGEISRLNRRTIELETGNKRLTKRMENWKKQLALSDEALRESKEREAANKSIIAERDERIRLLENQVETLNRDRLEMLNKIDSLEKERTILMSERESSVEENLKRNADYDETIRKLNQELISEREVKNQIQCDLMARIQSLEEDQNQLINDLTSIKSEAKSEKASNKELNRRIQILEGSFSELEKEYENYKEKATKTLASKDQVIRKLERGSETGDEGIVDSSDSQIEHHADKIIFLQHQIHSLKNQLNELQIKHDSALDLERIKSEEIDSLVGRLSDANERLSSLNEELMNEKRGKETLLQDYIQLQEEYKYSKEEGKKLREGLNQRLNDKEMEIDKLRKQLTSKASTQILSHFNTASLGSSAHGKSTSGPSSSETESRIKSLTDSLMQKQAMVESLNSERNSLTLQLERCQSRLRSYQDHNPDSPVSVTIGMVHSSSASSLVNRYRPLMEESVQDGQVARGVKRAYSQLDYFSIRLGQFLRVYPGARIMVLFYILVLHLWVFYLLFTYEPEVHNDL